MRFRNSLYLLRHGVFPFEFGGLSLKVLWSASCRLIGPNSLYGFLLEGTFGEFWLNWGPFLARNNPTLRQFTFDMLNMFVVCVTHSIIARIRVCLFYYCLFATQLNQKFFKVLFSFLSLILLLARWFLWFLNWRLLFDLKQQFTLNILVGEYPCNGWNSLVVLFIVLFNGLLRLFQILVIFL